MSNESSPVERIKAETRDAHESTEETLNERFSPENGLDRASFEALLEAHYGLYATPDPRLEKATERLLDDFAYQPRTPRLRRDLIALGADAGDIESLPTLEPDTVPAWAERTRLLGALYVVEGSELGGLVIRRELDEVLDDEAREADAFYQSERQHVGERWNAFRALFDTHVDEGEAFERAVEGAHEMFQLYEDWFG